MVLSSRNTEACAQAQQQLSEFGDVWAVSADLSRHEECERLADLVTADSGSLDILVNNAGAMWDEPLATFPTAVGSHSNGSGVKVTSTPPTVIVT